MISTLNKMCAGLVLAAGLIAPLAEGRADGVRYVDPAYGFALTAPPGWTRKDDMPRPYIAFLGPVDDGFQANLTIYSEPAANKTLQQYVRTARETIRKSKSLKLQSDRPASLGGAPAVMLESLVTLEGQPPSVSRQVVAVRRGRGYMVTLAARPAVLKRYLPAFDRVISSFRWKR